MATLATNRANPSHFILGARLATLLDQVLNVGGRLVVVGGEAPEGVKDGAVAGAAAEVAVQDLLDLGRGRRWVVSSEAEMRGVQ